MEYRLFNKTGEKISLLGMGTMRLPMDSDGKIDEAESIKMIRYAIDKGVNYVDTAWMYHDGESEVLVGKALKDGYREKVFLADKLPVWYTKTEEDMEKLFQTQLERCDTDYFDMYLLHNVNKPFWKRAKKVGALEFLEKKKAEGKIKHLGFSFHDEEKLFEEVLDAHDWDFCQIQLNYMDKEFQAGVKGLKYAGEKNIPVIIMEPLKGGKLVDKIPAEISEYWNQADVKRTPAEWALRWVSDFPQVLTILSGMSNMEQIEENLRILDGAKANSLTKKEQSIIDKVALKYNELIKYPCTSCKYCMPCPQKINIPTIISMYNEWFLYDENGKTKEDFYVWNPEGQRPSDCTDCKACEGNCPQGLPVSQIMKQAKEIFE